MSEENSTEKAAAAVAARRRARKSGDTPPSLPSAPGGVESPIAPDVAPVVTAPGTSVLVASSLVSEYAAQVYTGITGARIGAQNVSYGAGQQPLVQPQSNVYGTNPHEDNYVVAEFDAMESMVPPGCKTPVSRLLWRAGWRVRKDFYTDVTARRSPADQEAARLSPAKMPVGVDAPPPELTVAAAAIASPPGAPA